MSPMRRVDPRRAGPHALGILIPPGNPTILILRPRDLPWDLLLVRTGEGGEMGTPFLHLEPEDATAIAEGVCRALQRNTTGEVCRVEEAYAPEGNGYWVQASLAAFPFIACVRCPGQPYRPAAFATIEEVRTAVQALAEALERASGLDQEVYINTQNFGR